MSQTIASNMGVGDLSREGDHCTQIIWGLGRWGSEVFSLAPITKRSVQGWWLRELKMFMHGHTLKEDEQHPTHFYMHPVPLSPLLT